jgi:hypothetical protein
MRHYTNPGYYFEKKNKYPTSEFSYLNDDFDR